jgi:hypothetical protein
MHLSVVELSWNGDTVKSRIKVPQVLRKFLENVKAPVATFIRKTLKSFIISELLYLNV